MEVLLLTKMIYSPAIFEILVFASHFLNLNQNFNSQLLLQNPIRLTYMWGILQVLQYMVIGAGGLVVRERKVWVHIPGLLLAPLRYP